MTSWSACTRGENYLSFKLKEQLTDNRGSGELEEFLNNAGVLVDPIPSDATTDVDGNKPPQGS